MSESNQIEPNSTSVLFQLYAMLFEIDVAQEGVRGAKHFFEAKVSLSRMARRRCQASHVSFLSRQKVAAINNSDRFHREIREEQEQRRRADEDAIRRKLLFHHRRAQFQTT